MVLQLLLDAPFTDRFAEWFRIHSEWGGSTVAILAGLCLLIYWLVRRPHLKRAKRHPTLSALQLEEMLQGPPPLILDLREEVNFQKDGHIKGSVHIPFHLFPIRVKEVVHEAKEPKQRAVVLIDEHDLHAHEAADLLAANGVTWLYVLMDGFKAWKKAGYRVTK